MDGHASPSLFALLNRELGHDCGRFTVQMTKVALLDLSQLLEDIVLDERLPALICVGFQEARFWQESRQRYELLEQQADLVVAFAGGLPPEQSRRALHVPLAPGSAMALEWFLLIVSERFAALVCARDLQLVVDSDGDRMFEAIWSLEPPTIAAALRGLRDHVAQARPERVADLDAALARFAIPAPDPRLLSIFTSRLIDGMVRQQQMRLRMERTLAHESRLRALGLVISGVAHELNNPLQSVLGFASMLMEDRQLSCQAHEDLQHIVDAAERARGIVQSLSQLSRPVADSRVPTDLHELIAHTLIYVRADMEAAHVLLDCDFAPNLPKATVNPLRIQQLLINLLSNATQALAGHAGPRRIALSVARYGGDQIELRVADSGPGIPYELRELVFEPFFTTKAVGQGTGLGLSIVRTIVAEHQGTLDLTSWPGEGAVFTIRLPVGRPPARRASVSVDAPGCGTVLLVDDDPQIKVLLQRILDRAGYVTLAASSVTEALGLLASRPFDAVISDVLMPDMDGIAFHSYLAKQHPNLARRTVFITGDASRQETRAFLQEISAPFLLKPFSPADLLSTMRRVLPISTA